MASKLTIATTLAYLHELYPSRDITATLAEAWASVFADWPDEELTTCAMQAARTPGRSFFPTPGEIAAYRTAAVIVDGAVQLRRISKLGRYTPTGWRYPEVEVVRAALGDVIAYAYATAGGARCFDDNETTRAIASREFHRAATEYAAMPAAERPLLESGAPPRRVSSRTQRIESLGSVVERALLMSPQAQEPTP